MSLHHIANHLASKGRNGDTTLVHMTKGEVAGLQALAKANGTSLTRNPDTGLPEAFGLKQLLPMAAGAALTPFVGPMGAAAIVGGLGYMQSGSLTQGLMAGMGAYGGAGLMGGATAAGTQEVAGQAMADEAAKQQAQDLIAQQTAAAQQTATQQTALDTMGQSATTPQAIENVYSQQNALFNKPPVQDSVLMGEGPVITEPIAAAEKATSGMQPISNLTRGATANADQLAAVKANTGTYELAGKGFSNLGTEAGRDSFVRGLAPNGAGTGYDLAKYSAAAAAPIIADKMTPEKYVPPEIKGDSDMGQRYAYDSGYSNDIPGRTGPAAYKQISNEEAKKLYGFAEGGEVGYPGEPVVRMASGGSAGYTGNVGDYSAADAQAARSGYGLGIDYSGYDTQVAPMAGVAALPAARAITSTTAAPEKGFRYDPMSRSYVGSGTDANYIGGGQYGKTAAEVQAEADAAATANDYVNVGYSGAGGGAQGGLMPNDLHYAQGGISTLGGYSDGGRLLKGPGDGMSDNIPAKIGAKQPARLADGEFVVPADVVSHLGNGSTDAGAKQLYKMMDKIRTARTGRKAQGKQVNPNKFLPA